MSLAPALNGAHNREALARARGSLAQHRREFRALERYALDAEDFFACTGRAQWAFDAGARRHPGLLVSAGLEQRVNELGRAFASGSGGRSRRPGGRVGRVLHVLTQAYEFGGHTRVAERWIQIDAEHNGRTPTVLLTGQAGLPVPDTLQHAARNGGGGLLELGPGNLLARAWNLRALAEQHDLVVIHHHPQDLVPALALADPEGRPPTVLFNHASDHIWIGMAVADVVANLWEFDHEQTEQRRGAATGASMILPIPVTPSERPTRSQARARLGIDPDVQLILAVGSSYKTAPVLEPSFTQLIGTVLQASPGARCLAVGPQPEDAGWAELRWSTGARAAALGRLDSVIVGQLMAAADVLLDTWPASGATTLLDAALAGLPVVSLGNGGPEFKGTRPTSGTLGGAMIHAPSASDAAEAVAELLGDEPRRAGLGEAARRHVDGNHLHGWPSHLEAVVERALERAGQAAPPSHDPPPQETGMECVLQLLHEAAGETVSLEQTLIANAADLPAQDRADNPDEAARIVSRTLSSFQEPIRRAVAAPALQAGAIAALLTQIERLAGAGEIAACAVAVPEPELARALALFEAELAGRMELDIQLVVADDVDAISRPGDLVLTS